VQIHNPEWYRNSYYSGHFTPIPTFPQDPTNHHLKPHNEAVFALDWLEQSGFHHQKNHLFQKSGDFTALSEFDDETMNFLFMATNSQFSEPTYCGGGGLTTRTWFFSCFCNTEERWINELVKSVENHPELWSFCTEGVLDLGGVRFEYWC